MTTINRLIDLITDTPKTRDEIAAALFPHSAPYYACKQVVRLLEETEAYLRGYGIPKRLMSRWNGRPTDGGRKFHWVEAVPQGEDGVQAEGRA